MKYFFDTEFIEGKQTLSLHRKNTIELISIGIAAEDGRTYYAISKEFNILEAWYRTQMTDGKTIYWLRDNVLYPIWKELSDRYVEENTYPDMHFAFGLKSFSELVNMYGKSIKIIAQEVKTFAYNINMESAHYNVPKKINDNNPIFYAYFADYDWVVFCWMFGKMIDLPKYFPYYCRDLKQTLDEKASGIPYGYDLELGLKSIEMSDKYPKQTNEHHALCDAMWTKELHDFLKTI